MPLVPEIIQVLIIASLNWISFSNGVVYGHVASIISSLQKKEENIDFTEGQIFLIATTLAAMGIFGLGLAAAVTDKVGRRWAFILFSIPTTLNFTILYPAKELYQFILSRAIAGVSVNALIVLNVFITSEYTSPRTRGFFLNMVSTVAPAIGTCFVHGIGIVLHWRTVSLIATFIASLGIVLPYFWVESPHWLASKGKIKECETAFRILHTDTSNSERELQQIIKMETRKLVIAKETNRKPTLKRLLLAFKRHYFWGLLFLSVLLNIYYVAAGKLIFSILATVILEEITGTSDVLLFTLFVDGFVIIGSCLSCILIKKTSMRTLLFSTGFTACAILTVFSVSYYFKSYLNNNYFNWINVTLLALYFIIVNAGPYPIVEAIQSEMFPLELKVYMFFISGSVLIITSSLMIIVLPYAVNAMGYHGLFLVNAAISCIALGYTWLRLPETKGKTLQEIEMYFKANSFDVDAVLNNEQTDNLL